jgi:thioredoxin
VADTAESLVLGVDFGTCLSSVVVGQADGTLLRVKDPVSLSFSVPSSVAVDKSGTLMFGTAAERVKLTRPYASQFKRDLSLEVPIVLGDQRLTPLQLTGRLLRWLRDQAEETAGRSATSVVITMPASYERHRRDMMLDAAVTTGFDPGAVTVVEEPVAAAAFALTDRPAEPGERLLIYDLGGGTFDVAVVEVTADGFQVLSHDGAPDVGGVLFDRLIADDVLERVDGLADLIAAGGEDPRGRARARRRRYELAEFCRELKHQLSSATHQEDWVPGTDEMYELSRDRFDAMIEPLLAETLERCDAAVEEAGLSWPQIDRVVLVGGSTRIPGVGRTLAEARGRAVQRLSEPELAVAEGAAWLGRRAASEARRALRRTDASHPQGEKTASSTVTVTDASFADVVLNSDKLVLVDFWAKWCGPCRMVAPVLEEIAGEHPDKITIAKLDIDANPTVTRDYQVLSIPAQILFKGGKPVKQIVGTKPKAALLADLSDYLGSPPPAPADTVVATSRELEVMSLTWVLKLTTHRILVKGSWGDVKCDRPTTDVSGFSSEGVGVRVVFADGKSVKVQSGLLYQGRVLKALEQVTGLTRRR